MFSVEELRETLRRLSGILEAAGIRHHFTGGLVSSFYGEPRLTQDIDVVVDPIGLKRALPQLLAAAQPYYSLNPDVISEAVAAGKVFQLLDKNSLIKIDLYPRQLVPGELDRSVTAEFLPGLTLRLLTKEDAILAKLIWITRGSHKSRRDVRMMLLADTRYDEETLRERAAELGLLELLQELLESDGHSID